MKRPAMGEQLGRIQGHEMLLKSDTKVNRTLGPEFRQRILSQGRSSVSISENLRHSEFIDHADSGSTTS